MARNSPAYHQAFMAEARRLWPTYECPCGCDAKPTVEDLARDLWVQSIVGSHVAATRPLQSFVPPQSSRHEAGEPAFKYRCRGCGSQCEIYEYLAAFLKLKNAPWPECDECLRMLEQ